MQKLFETTTLRDSASGSACITTEKLLSAGQKSKPTCWKRPGWSSNPKTSEITTSFIKYAAPPLHTRFCRTSSWQMPQNSIILKFVCKRGTQMTCSHSTRQRRRSASSASIMIARYEQALSILSNDAAGCPLAAEFSTPTWFVSTPTWFVRIARIWNSNTTRTASRPACLQPCLQYFTWGTCRSATIRTGTRCLAKINICRSIHRIVCHDKNTTLFPQVVS
jgi:hypothetical protein